MKPGEKAVSDGVEGERVRLQAKGWGGGVGCTGFPLVYDKHKT